MSIQPTSFSGAAVMRAIPQRAQVVFACTILAMVAAVGLQILHPRVAHAATTYTFTGLHPGDHCIWTEPANWSPQGVPGPEDDVIIPTVVPPGGSNSVCAIPAGTSIHGLTLQRGAGIPFGGSPNGDLTVTATLDWTGGGLGVPLTVPVGGTTSISGDVSLDGSAGARGVLNLAGSTTFSGTLSVMWGGGDVINNTGTFTAQPGASMVGSGSGQRFNNRGSLVVPEGQGTPRSSAYCPNVGAMGGVVLICNMPYNAGPQSTTTVARGSNLELQSFQSTWSDGVTFSGEGRTLIGQGATVTLLGGVTLGPGHTLELGPGTISGNGTLTGNGTFVWSAGTLDANLSVSSTITTAIQGPANKVLGGSGTRALNLAGPTTLSGGRLNLYFPSVLNNTGTLTMQGASVSRGGFGCCSRFTNAGSLINDAGSGTTTIDSVELANTGTIQLLSGVLRLNFPSFTEPDGATLLVTLRGTAPGTDFGQLQVSNNATWGGNLLLTNANGFIPTPGQTFRVLTCGVACSGQCDGTCPGQFAAVSVNYLAQYNPQNVTLIPLTAIALDPADPTIAQGTTQPFTATGTYGDGSSFDLTSWVTWATQDATIASIDQTGLATGTGPGTTTISATADTISGTTTITVVSGAAPSTIRNRPAPAIGPRRPAPPVPARPPVRSGPRGRTSVLDEACHVCLANVTLRR